jgi:hypothetical protein
MGSAYNNAVRRSRTAVGSLLDKHHFQLNYRVLANHHLAGCEKSLADATRFLEPRRFVYNFVLTAVAVVWLVAAWPHFRAALTLSSLLLLAILALLANVCYCAAYLVDIPMRRSALSAVWGRRCWGLWLLGILLAIGLENYWIADEIYPSIRFSDRGSPGSSVPCLQNTTLANDLLRAENGAGSCHLWALGATKRGDCAGSRLPSFCWHSLF